MYYEVSLTETLFAIDITRKKVSQSTWLHTIKPHVLCVIVRVTHSKSVWSFSSVTGLKVRTFLYRPITQAVSGVFANTRPDRHKHTCFTHSLLIFCRNLQSKLLLGINSIMWLNSTDNSRKTPQWFYVQNTFTCLTWCEFRVWNIWFIQRCFVQLYFILNILSPSLKLSTIFSVSHCTALTPSLVP